VTAWQEGLSMTIVLLDNPGFRCIHYLSTACGGANPFNDFRRRDPASGTLTGELLPIDFAANAASLGARVLSADTPTQLERALTEAAGLEGGPVVIVVEIEPEPSVPDYDSWWDVPVAEVSSSPRVQAARRTYEANLARERSFV
jgi:3D-(3,5/4)-trihydroxycyclohexane-1,2-dione acylhydrolase (decyclizing)